MMKYNGLKFKYLVLEAKKNGKSLSDVANNAEVHFNTARAMFTDLKRPSLEVLEKVATYFKVDANYFFDMPQEVEQDMPSVLAEPTEPYGVNYKAEAEMYKKLYYEILDRVTKNSNCAESKPDSKRCG